MVGKVKTRRISASVPTVFPPTAGATEKGPRGGEIEGIRKMIKDEE
jgi:hypothetical protein